MQANLRPMTMLHTSLYASAALALALISVPVALATVSREQGWRVVHQAWQLVVTVPRLLINGVAKWEEKVLSGFRSALREAKTQTCRQAGAVFFSVFVALLTALTLFISFSSTLAGVQGSEELVVEVLSAENVTPITLISLEAVLACCYLGALLFDAVGATDIFYLRVSRLSCMGWKQSVARALLVLIPIVGTAGSAYVVYQNGVVRESVVGKSGSESLLESSGLSSGQASPDQASPDQVPPTQGSSGEAASTSEAYSGDDLEWALPISTIGPSLLGFFAGMFAFANSIPAMAFLAAGACGLLWLSLAAVHATAYTVAKLLKQARSLMLSLFNLTLELQDKPPVGSVQGPPVQKNENTGLQTTSGGPASPEKKAGEETSSERISSEEGADSDRQLANDGPEEKGPGDNGLKKSGSDKTGPGEANRDETNRDETSRDETSRDETGRDETDRDRTGRDETSHDSTAASGGKNPSLEDTFSLNFSLNEKLITGRVFQPWWFKNPPSQRPSSPDDAGKEPGCFYGTLSQAAKASRSRKASRRACVLELRLKENGNFDFLGRHELPLRESGEDA